jgi:hypothetical protein
MNLRDKLEVIIDLADTGDFAYKATYYVHGMKFIKEEFQKIMELGTTGAGNKIITKYVNSIDEVVDAFTKYITDLSKQYPDYIKIDLFERGVDPKKAMGIGTGLPESIIPETASALSSATAVITSAIADPKLQDKPLRALEFGYKIGAAIGTASKVSHSERGTETKFYFNKLISKFLDKLYQGMNAADRDLNAYSGN